MLILFVITISIVLYFIIIESLALYYTFRKYVYCDTLPCDNIIKDNMTKPEKITDNFDKDMALYGADLINRLDNKIIQNSKDIKLPDNFKLLYTLKYDNLDYGVILQDINNIWIIFRGSKEVSDWMKNIEYDQTLFKKSISKQTKLFDLENSPKVHSGFLNIYKSFRNDILDFTDKYKPDNIFVFGHSAGSALGVITSVDIFNIYQQKNLTIPLVIYTFASPRIGDTLFAKYVDSIIKIYRLVNTDDIAVSNPPATSPNYDDYKNPLIYEHCGFPLYSQINFNSLYRNHSMNCYIYGLENNLFK
jgi:triacylglycerol lipase